MNRTVRAAATTPSAKQFQPGQISSFFGYGYQTWSVPGKERQFVLRGLRGQGLFVDPKAKLVMVHTAAGNVGDPAQWELTELWFGVVKSLAEKQRPRANADPRLRLAP